MKNIARILREDGQKSTAKTVAVVLLSGAAIVSTAIGVKQIVAPGKPIFKRKNGVQDNLDGFEDDFEDISENSAAPESAKK